MNTSLVSVIIPIYNGEKYIEATINSVITQTYKNWELIIVNNGSTDNSLSLASKFAQQDERIKVISLQDNSGGPAHPRNIGINASNGSLIAFLDADDLWLETKLEKQVEALEDYDVGLCCSVGALIDSNNQKIGVLNRLAIFKYLHLVLSTRFTLMLYNPILLSSSLIKIDDTFDTRFREDKFLQSIEDWAFWIDLSIMDFKINALDEELCSYRTHSGSISGILGEKQYLKTFSLYSLLLVEGKMTLSRYLFLSFIHFLRIIRFRIFRRGFNS